MKTLLARRILMICAMLLAGWSLPGGAQAANRALLIGVSDYPANRMIRNLHGPRNDVSLMWRYLRESGFADDQVVVLANRLPSGPSFPRSKADPNYADIVRELDALALHDYDEGDMVVIFFAGHGIQLPQSVEKASLDLEAGGKDQALLPADTGGWTDDGRLLNALVDDEIGEKLDAIRARGANIWFITDACNSGGSTRATLGDDEARTIDPALLGIPMEAYAAAEAAAGTRSTGEAGQRVMSLSRQSGENWGDLVAFFAVDAFSIAYERMFEFADYQQPPVGTDLNGTKAGIFSTYLNHALMSGQARTFGDLYDEVVARVAGDPRNSSRPRPIAEGSLSFQIPWRESAPVMLRGVLERGDVSVPAGMFQGFDIGAVVTLYDPEDFDAPLATGRVVEATASNSVVSELIWNERSREVETMGLPVPVRVTRPAVRFSYRIGLPDNLAGLADGQERIRAIFDAAFTEGDPETATGVTVASHEDGDLNRLTHISDGRLWLLYPGESLPGGDSPSAVGIDLDGSDEAVAAALREAVWRLARAERLVRMAASYRPTGGEGEDVLVARAEIFRDETMGRAANGGCNWPRASRSGDYLSQDQLSRLRPVGQTLPAALNDCDILRIAVSNRSKAQADHYYVNGFYVDSKGGINPLGLYGARQHRTNCAFDLPPGQDGEIPIYALISTWDGAAQDNRGTAGIERLVILAVKRDVTGRPPNLCMLEQETLTRTIATRSLLDAGEAGSDLQMLLADVAGSTRSGGAAPQVVAQVEMQTFLFEFDLGR